MCHFPVNPLYIHHPSYRSHLLCSRSTAQARERVWLSKLLLLTELTPARSTALGEHTNSIISAGRRPFSLPATLQPKCSKHGAHQTHCTDTQHAPTLKCTLSKPFRFKYSSSWKTTFESFEKNKKVQIPNPFSFYWVGKCELWWTREFSLHTNPVKGHSKSKCCFLSCPWLING